MALQFTRTGAGVVARLDDAERAVLRDLFTDVAALLHEDRPPADDPLEDLVGITEGAVLPQDPALARLLPDASRDDGDAAADFRRLTEHGLRQRKQHALTTAAATLDGHDGEQGPRRPGRGRLGARGSLLVLDEEQARAWLTALNDVRLVLAERMGLRTDADAERIAALAAGPAGRSDPADPVSTGAALYDFLTWLQETLVHAVSGPAR